MVEWISILLASTALLSRALKDIANSAVVPANDAAAQRIRQMGAEADKIANRLKDLEKQTTADLNDVLNDATRSLFTLMEEARKEVRHTQEQLFYDLNDTLSRVNDTLDELPTINIPPQFVAVVPATIEEGAKEKVVHLHGFFPKDAKAWVKVGGKDVEVTRASRGRLAFKLPDALIEKAAVIDIALRVEVPKWLGITSDERTWTEQIHVLQSTPFLFKVSVRVPNPERVKVIRAPQVFTDEASTQANQSRPSVIETKEAKTIFSVLVPNAGEYDLESVEFADVRASINTYAACVDHAPATGRLTGWDKKSVSYELRAPSIGPHQHSGMRRCEKRVFGKRIVWDEPYLYVHGGGGSKAVISLDVTFKASLTNVPAEAEMPPLTYQTARSALLEIDLSDNGVELNGEWSITIEASSDDYLSKWSDAAVLKYNDLEEVRPHWEAQVTGDVLRILSKS